MTDLSVVIPVHNGAELIEHQLESVWSGVSEPSTTEVLLVDNRSTDGTSRIAAGWSSSRGLPLRVVQAHERAGEPHARNVGWAQADGDLIAYCDADDEVGETWVEGMRLGLREDAYCTGPIRLERLNEPWQVRTRGREGLESPPATFGGIPFASGCNMGFRREALEQLGGFDETFLIGCDVEIGIRARQRGIGLGWSEGAVVHYRLRQSLGALYAQARAYGRSRSRIKSALHAQGLPTEPRFAAAHRAAWLVRNLPSTATQDGRARWVWVAGQAEGAARQRVRGAR